MERITSLLGIVVTGSLLLGACQNVQQVDDVNPSGFLAPDVYASLEPTNDELRAGLGYINSDIDFSIYDKILLDPIVSYDGEENSAYLNAEDAQILANNFYAIVAGQLSQDYELITIPEPNSLRMTLAVVRATEKNITLGTISTIVPAALAATQLASYVSGKPLFAGQLKIEFEVRDAVTRELVGAGIDTRAGGKVLDEDQFDAWSDVNKAMELYAVGMRYRLCLLRGGTDCEKPALY